MKSSSSEYYENYRAKQIPLERYVHLASLQDRNETLFFRLVHDHVDEMLPVLYTSVVGEACQKFSHIYRRPRGLYISYEQRDAIDTILANHSGSPAIIVVTDGERILGPAIRASAPWVSRSASCVCTPRVPASRPIARCPSCWTSVRTIRTC